MLGSNIKHIYSENMIKIVKRFINISKADKINLLIHSWFNIAYDNKLIEKLDKNDKEDFLYVLNNFSKFENELGKKSLKLYQLINF